MSRYDSEVWLFLVKNHASLCTLVYTIPEIALVSTSLAQTQTKAGTKVEWQTFVADGRNVLIAGQVFSISIDGNS